MVRKATEKDFSQIASLYDEIHTAEEQGLLQIGWKREIYPTAETVRTALDADDLFVIEEDGVIAAAGRINQTQVDVYALVPWEYEAEDEEVMVLHMLAVRPSMSGKGYGSAFERFYEDYALERGCAVLRIDTNERNTKARRLYSRLGYREAATVPCVFNGIPGVPLVCLEKRIR